jgi:hypothetical protein
MRGLDPRIHQSSQKFMRSMMDCRVKPGNDAGYFGATLVTLGQLS